jgi:hypothetical protein
VDVVLLFAVCTVQPANTADPDRDGIISLT